MVQLPDEYEDAVKDDKVWVFLSKRLRCPRCAETEQQLSTANEKLAEALNSAQNWEMNCCKSEEHAKQLEAELTKLKELLKGLEWSGNDEGWNDYPHCPECGRGTTNRPYCPWCGRLKDEGHAPDCELFLALEGEGEK